ncbi:type II toxin-antitoxin system RelE/ParE family toxin [candidate division WWE3 bacterium CG_4_10_14_0_2_um_filter_42_7]|uniref:Type II toxin-antitoxin system RelE/ParE family toxin n=2 Tax=Katanobacteria TaxID=422282 RepID=A0A2H0X8U6_UNCKA|nr:MAG: type II toxin-antitoxin system RelE/ParE family toxin [candidate division WWE3 bacterium CG08_land_8_20_14_0_20_41_15]PIZ43573.1 MAG: type II toxin-antitoxin system RelE/ParE family toxin [candidate division WWE3 bacterium CG_4_10_14_0_2_um_filter_42_7]
MKVAFDTRAEKVLQKLSNQEKAKVDRVISLFIARGFLLTEFHLKKIAGLVWELRAGDIRLLFGVLEDTAIIVNIFSKRTQKTPLREIELSKERLKHYQ